MRRTITRRWPPVWVSPARPACAACWRTWWPPGRRRWPPPCPAPSPRSPRRLGSQRMRCVPPSTSSSSRASPFPAATSWTANTTGLLATSSSSTTPAWQPRRAMWWRTSRSSSCGTTSPWTRCTPGPRTSTVMRPPLWRVSCPPTTPSKTCRTSFPARTSRRCWRPRRSSPWSPAPAATARPASTSTASAPARRSGGTAFSSGGERSTPSSVNQAGNWALRRPWSSARGWKRTGWFTSGPTTPTWPASTRAASAVVTAAWTTSRSIRRACPSPRPGRRAVTRLTWPI